MTDHKGIKKLAFQYEILWKESLDPIFIANTDYEILEGNPAMRKLFDRSGNQWGNMKDFFREPEEFERFSQIFNVQKYVEDFETELITRNNEIQNCIVHFVKYTPNEGVDTFLGFIRNITRRKRAERKLLMAEKLTVTGKIARTIAHELRNPMTNLNLAIDQLSEELPEESDGDFYIEILKRNLSRIENLISELLNSSKPREYTFATKDINETVREAVELVIDRFTLKKMTIDTDLDQNSLVYHDKEQIKIALLNLMVNASEAMEEGSGKLRVNSYNKGQELVITISDNGKGIEKEKINQLFEPFFSDSKEKGMGLGLTAVQNIIHGHNGHIDVDSIPGEGTEFSIFLPNKTEE